MHRNKTVITMAIMTLALLSPTVGSSISSASSVAKTHFVGAPIKIGWIGSLTGSLSQQMAQRVLAARAIVDLENAQGGIHGHKVELLVADDASSPAGALTATQTLISEGAVGLVASTGLFDGAAEAYGDAQHVPWSTVVTSVAEVNDPNVYEADQTSGSAVPGTTSFGLFFKSLGVTTLAGIAPGSGNTSTATVGLMHAAINGAQVCCGIKVVLDDISPSGTTTDFTADALRLKSSGAQGSYMVSSIAQGVEFSQAVQQQGVHVKALYLGTVYERSSLAVPGLNDAYTESQILPAAIHTSANAAFLGALKKYAPGTYGGFAELLAYDETDLLITGLEGVKGTPTGAKLGAAIGKLRHYTGSGLLPTALNYTLSKTGPVNVQNCFWYLHIVNGAFKPLNGGKPICGKLVANS